MLLSQWSKVRKQGGFCMLWSFRFKKRVQECEPYERAASLKVEKSACSDGCRWEWWRGEQRKIQRATGWDLQRAWGLYVLYNTTRHRLYSWCSVSPSLHGQRSDPHTLLKDTSACLHQSLNEPRTLLRGYPSRRKKKHFCSVQLALRKWSMPLAPFCHPGTTRCGAAVCLKTTDMHTQLRQRLRQLTGASSPWYISYLSNNLTIRSENTELSKLIPSVHRCAFNINNNIFISLVQKYWQLIDESLLNLTSQASF